MTQPTTNPTASRSVVAYLWRIIPYLRPYWRLAGVSAVVIVAGGLISLLAPWALKIVVDHGLGRQPLPPWLGRIFGPLAASPGRIIVAAVVFGFLIAFIADLLTVLNTYLNTRIEQNMVLDFRSDLFEHAQRLSLSFHDQRRSGMIIYGINFQADAVARLVMAFPPLAQSLITLVGMFWIVFRMDWRLALLSMTVVPFLYY